MQKYCYRCEKDVDLVTDADSNAKLCSLCGTVIIRSASHLPPGTVLGGFEIIDELGRGGMGIVYRAKQLNLERDVALKVLADDLAKDHEFVMRFFKEARAAASLNHPNIVQVFDAGSTPEGISYFAMELIEGETLESHIEQKSKLPPKEALKVAVQIAGALDYAWKSQKLTHGDIKPDNIILNNKGGAKLADLGLAKFVHDEASDDGIMATPLYAPPEVIKGDINSIGYHSDMYSFGATLYQMLAGVPLFPDNSPEIVFQQHLSEQPSHLSSYNEKFAPELVKLVDQMLEKNPDNRPETWEDVYKGLKKIKEPEISRKVFHTHANSHEEQYDGNVINKPDIFSVIVKCLIGLIIVLAVAVVAVFFISNMGNEGKEVPVSIEDPNEIFDQWEEIKEGLPKISIDQALFTVRKFIEDNENIVPDDALKTLESLEKESETQQKIAEQNEAEAERFNVRLNSLLQDLQKIDLNDEDIDISKISVLNNRIENLLKRTADIEHLSIKAEDRKIIDGAFDKISARITKYNEKMEMLRKEKLAKEQEERLKQEKIKLAKKAKEYADMLSLCKTIDNYYLAIANFQESKKLSTLKEGIQNWGNDSDLAPSEYTLRVNFLKNNVIPNAPDIYALFQTKKSYFENRTLPEEMCTEKIRNYKIKDITSSGIKLAFTSSTSKVTLGHNIPWNSVTPEQLTLMLNDILVKQDEGILDNNEKNVVLSFILLGAPEKFSDIFDLMKSSLYDKKLLWQLLKKDFDIAGEESKCIKLYTSLTEAINLDNYTNASSYMQELLSVSKNTKFNERYSKILKSIKERLKKYSPDTAALELINKCLELPLDNASEIFNTAMVIESRYHHCKDRLNKNKFRKFLFRKKNALLSLINSSGVDSISDNRVPFYYWTKEKEAASRAYLNILERKRSLQSIPQMGKLINLAVNVDDGNWHKVREGYFKIPVGYFNNERETKKVESWITSFLFAYGLADLQFGDGSLHENIHREMKNIYEKNISTQMSPLVTTLALEYSLLTRQREFPQRIMARYHFAKKSTVLMNVRIGMLGMLTNIEKEKVDVYQYRFLRNRIQKTYDKVYKLNADLFLMEQVELLLSGKPIPPANIRKLIAGDCYFPDTSARLLLSGLSIYNCKNSNPMPGEEKLIKYIEKQVTPLTVSGDLWRRLILFKMAKNPYAGDIARLSDEALDDTRICTLRFYPGLLKIKTGSEYSLGNFSSKDAELFLKSYLGTSALIPKSDINDLLIISCSNPHAIVTRLFKEHKVEKAFNYGIFGIMMHCKDPMKQSEILSVMENYSKSLCWEERFLLRQIQNWR